jgi:putative nucleotidyltransferase with HDIG domain
LIKASFNIAQAVISVGLAGYVYTQFLDPGVQAAIVRPTVDYVGYLALATTFFAVNIVLASTAIALIKQQRLLIVFKQVIGPRGGNLWYDLLASPIAIVPAILYFDYFVTGILIILLPLLLIRYSYLSKVQLEEANRDLLKVLVKAIETRDPYTSGHSVRVATLARLIAEDLRLPERRIDEIETAALLHDIGKIDSIYETVIRKPYDLNEEERDLIRTHATKGADLLQSLSSVSAEVIRGVRHHHERCDGTGYPDGLRGAEIPMAGRIIMLCDSVDAMLSDRPYRRALSISKVRSELIRCSGTQFDPAIVQVVLSKNTLERAAGLVAKSTEGEVQVLALTGSALKASLDDPDLLSIARATDLFSLDAFYQPADTHFHLTTTAAIADTPRSPSTTVTF